MKEKSLFISIFVIVALFLAFSCNGWAITFADTSLSTYRADVSTDIVVSATKDVPVFYMDNLALLNKSVDFSANFSYMENELIIYCGFGTELPELHNHGTFKSKISDSSAVYTIPPKTTSGWVLIGVPDIPGGLYDIACSKTLYINYPQTLSFSDNTVDTGQEITITSSKPFFDIATFSQSKLDDLLSKDYYIVWVESQIVPVYTYTVNNSNLEKRPVTSEYYVNVTTDSITIKIPPYAKTGTVHIINEAGFIVEGDGNPLVTKPDAPAYFSSSVDLVVNN